jgi:aryl-alcohol dehydrogenase-like predicted oxidoreductase
MLKGHATAEDTGAYVGRFTEFPGNYRPMLGLAAGSIGIGTYLGEYDDGTDQAYEDALRLGLASGINLIDTAVNYRFQRSERVIGKVIGELVRERGFKRGEFIVATKGGYITFDREPPENPREWFERTYLKPGIVSPDEIVEGSHCIAPRYLERMLEMSRVNLDLETIDIYYLHNPETQLEAIGRDEFRHRIRAAFELLERKVEAGWLRFYGTATWNGYRVERDNRSYLSLAEMVAIAREVAGDQHHFRVIQMPYNLAMAEAFTRHNQLLPDGSIGSALAAADAMGIATCASASLLQGRLAKGLPAVLGEAFGLESDAQRALQFVRSTPGINVALVGMSSTAHVLANLKTARQPPASFESLMKLFKPADQ